MPVQPVQRVTPTRLSFRGFALGPWVPGLLGVLCFANTLGNEFVRDDPYLVAHNPRIRSLTNWQGLWLTNWWLIAPDDPGLPPAQPDSLYRPLTLFSFAVNYALDPPPAGLPPRPAGFLLTNAVLHGITCMLVWLLTRRLTGDVRVAAITALLFAVHPVHCEAIANVVGRADILGALFLASALIVLLPSTGAASAGRGTLAAGLFFLALLSKESSASYVGLASVALALRGAAVPRERRLAWAGVHALLLLAPLAAYLSLRYYVLGNLAQTGITQPLGNPLIGVTGIDRWLGVFTIAGYYARAIFFPIWLSSDYGAAIVDPRAGVSTTTVIGVLSSVGVVLLLAGYLSRGIARRRAATAALMLMMSYFLISNAFLTIGTALGERLAYWPSVPLFILLGAMGVAAFERIAARPALARGAITVGVLVLAVLAARTVRRNVDWGDGARLAAVDVSNWPQSASLHAAHAWYLGDSVRRGTAVGDPAAIMQRTEWHARESWRIFPNRCALQIVIECLASRGETAAAIELLREQLVREPDDWRTHANLTTLLAGIDRAAALRHAREAYRLESRSKQTRLNLASALADNGLLAEAIEILRLTERELRPDDEHLTQIIAMRTSLEAQIRQP